jgi:hypothetical protein
MTQLKVVVWNCSAGLYDRTPNLAGLAAGITGFDVALLCELDRNTNKSMVNGIRIDQPVVLAKTAGYPYVTIGKRFDYDGGERVDAVLSRLPLFNTRTTILDRVSHPFAWGRPGPRALTEVTVSTPTGPVRLATTRWTNDQFHDDPQREPVLDWDGTGDRLKESQHTRALLSAYSGMPTVLGGDLNACRNEPSVAQLFKYGYVDAMTSIGFQGIDFLLYRDAPDRRLKVLEALRPPNPGDASDHGPPLAVTFDVPARRKGGWESLGGDFQFGPAVCSWGKGRIDVFGADRQDRILRHRWFVDGEGWYEWEKHGTSTINSAPAAVAWGPQRIDVFARGGHDWLWHRWYTQTHGWEGWEALGGRLSGAPTVCSWKPGRLDVFVRDVDGMLKHKWFVAGERWYDWETLGNSPIGGAPAAVSWASGRIDVVARGADDQLRHVWFVAGEGWSGWESLGGTLTSDPAICSWQAGRLDIFVRGTNNALWHKWYVNGEGWYEWESLGDHIITSSPAAVSWSNDRIDVVARGGNNAIYRKWFDGYWHPQPE